MKSPGSSEPVSHANETERGNDSKKTAVQHLRCEYGIDPLGIDVARPRLSWILESDVRGQRQTAYRIQVASCVTRLVTGDADFWDSGRVVSGQSVQVGYEGRVLRSRERCWWWVTVWDKDGTPVKSEPAFWEMGLLEETDWCSAWVGIVLPADEERPGAGRYLRTGFTLARPVRQARLYATALGVYEAYLNGQRVGDHVLAPGWTDYRIRTMVQTYDVTALLAQGEHALGALLGDGWFCGHVGLAGRECYGSPRPAFLAQLMIEYKDGSSEIVGTGPGWRGASGPIVCSDLLMGETYDARREMPGWNTAGFEDAAWAPVKVREVETRRVAQVGPPVRRMQELPARSVHKVGDEYIVDLGQNMVGWARLRVSGTAGTTVTLRFAEMLEPDGSLYTTNLRAARCIDHYTLKGGGEEVYEPAFTFHGFRYVGVSGYPGEWRTDAVSGIVVHSDTPVSGAFECSDQRVNQLQHNIVWGQRGNFLSVPTDCPQRDERLGWTGDAQAFIRTATYNMEVAGFFTKWLIDLDDDQKEDGAFPDVAPHVATGVGTSAWGDAGVICPWTIYLCYGDRRILSDHYAAMVRWIEYCRRHSDNLIRRKSGSDYGDWLSIEASTPLDVLCTAYFAYSTSLVARIAAVLGHSDAAADFRQLFEAIRAAFNREFVDADGQIKGQTQTAYLLALAFDLLDEEKTSLAVEHLVADIEARGHLSTGFVGVRELCPVLSRFGHHDLAYRLLLTDSFPSWLFPVQHGATTIWERWDGWTPDRGFQDPGMNSFNHYALGSVGQWLFETVGGIAPDPAQPGYEHIILRPRPGPGLTWARCTYASMYGMIETHWRRDDHVLTLEITLPINTMTTLHVPCTDVAQVREGGRAVREVEGLRFLRMAEGAAVFDAVPGTYQFTAT